MSIFGGTASYSQYCFNDGHVFSCPNGISSSFDDIDAMDALVEAAREWCDEHYIEAEFFPYCNVRIRNDVDAVHFRLRWG